MIESLLRILHKGYRACELALRRLQLALSGRKAHVDGLTLLLPGNVLSTDAAFQLLSGGVDGEDRRLMRKYGRPGDFVLNLGGGCGLSAMAAFRSIQPGGRVVVVEPDADVLDVARRNFHLNSMDAIQSLHGAAVAERSPAEVAFFKKKNYYGSNMLHLGGMGKALRVPAIYPPDVLPSDISGRRVLLCDVEGIETSLLATREVIDCFDLILAELHPWYFRDEPASPYVKMFHVLHERGFRVVDVDDEVLVFARDGAFQA